MSSNDAGMETALLEIAKDLLQASDDLASTDPSASAKLANEAYEIGRDLGIVRDHVDDTIELTSELQAPNPVDQRAASEHANKRYAGEPVQETPHQRRDIEDEADADLFRILDRQKALLPQPVELAPVRKPARSNRSLTFESPPPRRSGWFGWMRPREWRHAG
ncbi:MAG: hypothetical protein ACR2P3_02725 [Geminicoccaceae bacterium]